MIQFKKGTKLVALHDYHVNPNNPYPYKSQKEHDAAIANLKKYPNFLYLRPIIVDDENMVLGGNKRFLGLIEIGYTHVPKEWIRKASELSLNEQRMFIVADNIGFGEWDRELLEEEFTEEELSEWLIEEVEPYEEEEEEQHPTQGTQHKIILEYNFYEYELVSTAFSQLQGSREEIVMQLLGIDIGD